MYLSNFMYFHFSLKYFNFSEADTFILHQRPDTQLKKLNELLLVGLLLNLGPRGSVDMVCEPKADLLLIP